MRSIPVLFRGCAVAVIGVATGCAHHRQDYAYAPPLVAPVYPQPPGPTVPGSYAPPLVTMPGPATAAVPGPAGTAPTAAVVADGQVPPCPPIDGATLVGDCGPADGALPAGATLVSDEPVGNARPGGTVVGAGYMEPTMPLPGPILR